MNLGVYIQVPFCQTKCTYCNFHTGVVAREKYEPYAEAVCQEIAEVACSGEMSLLRDAAVDTVYFGGGTPSLLESAALAGILKSLRDNFAFAGSLMGIPEVTLEADPETITPGKAEAWIQAGFNRISLGVQSFDDRELHAAGANASPGRYFCCGGDSSRSRISEYQHGFDCGFGAPDPGILGRVGGADSGDSARTHLDLPAGN